MSTVNLTGNLACATIHLPDEASDAYITQGAGGPFTVTCGKLLIGPSAILTVTGGTAITITTQFLVNANEGYQYLTSSLLAWTTTVPGFNSTNTTPVTLTYNGTTANCRIFGASLSYLTASVPMFNWRGTCTNCVNILAATDADIGAAPTLTII